MRPEGFWADPLGSRVQGVDRPDVVRTEWLSHFRITNRDRMLARHLAWAGPATAMQAAAWLGREERLDKVDTTRQRINKLSYAGWLRKMGWALASGSGTPLLIGPGALAERSGIRVRWAWSPGVVCRSVVFQQLLLRVRLSEIRWRRQAPYDGLVAARLRLSGREVVVAIPRRDDIEDRLSSELSRYRSADGIWVIAPASADLAAAVLACRNGGVLDRAAFATDVDLWRVSTPIADVWLVWSGETLQPARLRALRPRRSAGASA